MYFLLVLCEEVSESVNNRLRAGPRRTSSVWIQKMAFRTKLCSNVKSSRLQGHSPPLIFQREVWPLLTFIAKWGNLWKSECTGIDYQNLLRQRSRPQCLQKILFSLGTTVFMEAGVGNFILFFFGQGQLDSDAIIHRHSKLTAEK